MRVLITGANRGIGLELCRQYQSRGADVIAVCRTAGPELPGLDLDVREGVDVTSQADLEALGSGLDKGALDLLINNAGVLVSDNLDSLDFEGAKTQFEVNALGPLRVTQTLLPRLASGAKVGIVTSRMGSIEDNGSGGQYGYRMSKAAVNAAGKSLAVDLEPRGIAVALLHPGLVSTDMTGHQGICVAEAAQGLIQRLEDLELSSSGGFWHSNGERLPW